MRDSNDKRYSRCCRSDQRNDPAALADAPKAYVLGIDLRPLGQEANSGAHLFGPVGNDALTCPVARWSSKARLVPGKRGDPVIHEMLSNLRVGIAALGGSRAMNHDHCRKWPLRIRAPEVTRQLRAACGERDVIGPVLRHWTGPNSLVAFAGVVER